MTLGDFLDALSDMDLSGDSPDMNRDLFASATGDPVIQTTEVTVDEDGDIVIGLAR